MLVVKSKLWIKEQLDRLSSDERGVVAELLLIVGLVLLVVVVLAAVVPSFTSFITGAFKTAENSITSLFGGL
jgi:FlaG/FlaF family flagellin (archaellin)